MSAESASLKIAFISLKVINLPYVRLRKKREPYNGFKQNDFLRFILPIFLTLTSQGGNQGIAIAMGKKQFLLRVNSFFYPFNKISIE